MWGYDGHHRTEPCSNLPQGETFVEHAAEYAFLARG